MDTNVTCSTAIQEPVAGLDDVAALAVALGQVDAAHRRLRSRIARMLGITVTDLTALIVISDNDETTPKLLAAELGLASGTVTTMIDRLTDAGHVRRTPKAGDRRSLLITLTPEGITIIGIVWQLYLSAITLAADASPRLLDPHLLSSLRYTAAAIDSVGD